MARAIPERAVSCDPGGNRFVPARVLSADFIGRLIRVRQWDNNTEIATVLTGELRQLGANSAEVWIHLGVGAETEVRLDPDQPVTIDPPAGYDDVPELARYDEKV